MMAKRKRLVAPDQSELEKIDAGFAAKPPTHQGVTPPIAQVAGEAAALSGLTGLTDRVEAARDTADADKWRAAEQGGLVATAIAVEEIKADYLRRDRMVEDSEELGALISSIRESGLKTPIEVVQLEEGFGLISGHRRLKVFKRLAVIDPQFNVIPAFVRSHETSADAYLSMVEENEVRANLTHYERGRIAVLATQQGVFASLEDAVNRLFGTASKAKRSKVRSFASVHEALGDLLRYPTEISERLGLRLAAALRDGAQSTLRQAIQYAHAHSVTAEIKALEDALKALDDREKDPARGGRPTQVTKLPAVRLKSGGKLSAQVSPKGLTIDLKDRDIDAETAKLILKKIEAFLD